MEGGGRRETGPNRYRAKYTYVQAQKFELEACTLPLPLVESIFGNRKAVMADRGGEGKIWRPVGTGQPCLFLPESPCLSTWWTRRFALRYRSRDTWTSGGGREGIGEYGRACVLLLYVDAWWLSLMTRVRFDGDGSMNNWIGQGGRMRGMRWQFDREGGMDTDEDVRSIGRVS